MVLVYETNSWMLKNSFEIADGWQVAVSKPELGRQGVILILTTREYQNTLIAINGNSFVNLWNRDYSSMSLGVLEIADFNEDGKQEYILGGNQNLMGYGSTTESFLEISSLDGHRYTETRLEENWGGIYDFDWADNDSTGLLTYVFGSATAVQYGAIEMEEIQLTRSYLPLIQDHPCLQQRWDDFSDPSSGWPEGSNETYQYGYLQGEYQVLVRQPNAWITLSPGDTVEQFMLQADFRELNGTNGSYGLIFGIAEDWSELYTVEVAPNYGGYQVWHYTDAMGWELLLNEPWQYTRSFEMRLELEGAVLAGSLNGQQVFTYTFGEEPQPGRVGVIASAFDQPNLDVRVDNFGLWTGGCEASETSSQWMNPGQIDGAGQRLERIGIEGSGSKAWAGSR
jgi:hypothetical protein